jgi:flagella synthesis protein FlgN
VAAGAGPAIADLLAEETDTVRRFIAVLRQEQSLLADGQIDGLVAIAEEKSAFADRLGALARQRDAQVAAEGGENMGAWLAKPANQGQRDAWRQLLDLARQARSLNETNGKLIELRMQHNQQALAVLMAAADQAMTYGPDGQQRPAGGGRSFGSA